MTDTRWLDATSQAELVRRGEASPAELVDAAIERVEKLNGEVNAVIHPRFEQARAEAAGDLPDGPLRGVPFVLKDLVAESAGDPHHAGIAGVKAAGLVSDHDTELVRRFRAAGLVLIGKTNTPELGLFPTTEPAAYGPSRNPWDLGRSTGGSSGGSAAAVATGMVAIGHANDGGGSIRIPASECGLVGLKPSRGRVPLWPDLPESWGGLVAELAVTRSVRDTAAILDAVAGPCVGDLHTPPAPTRPYAEEVGADPGRLRIGLLVDSPDGATPVHPDCVAAAESAGRLLESLGHTVEVASPPALRRPDLVDVFLPCYGVWTAADLETYGQRIGQELTAEDVEPGTWAIAEIGRSTSGVRYKQSLLSLQKQSAAVQQWWAEGWDLLLTPTIPEPPPVLGQFGSPDNPLAGVFRSAAIVPFTAPFNITGQPAVSLPLHWNDSGLPIGVQFVAAYGREDVLIRLAAQLEQAQPWADRRPPL
jgi:amidase